MEGWPDRVGRRRAIGHGGPADIADRPPLTVAQAEALAQRTVPMIDGDEQVIRRAADALVPERQTPTDSGLPPTWTGCAGWSRWSAPANSGRRPRTGSGHVLRRPAPHRFLLRVKP
jgi:hypothetical protein